MPWFWSSSKANDDEDDDYDSAEDDDYDDDDEYSDGDDDDSEDEEEEVVGGGGEEGEEEDLETVDITESHHEIATDDENEVIPTTPAAATVDRKTKPQQQQQQKQPQQQQQSIPQRKGEGTNEVAGTADASKEATLKTGVKANQMNERSQTTTTSTIMTLETPPTKGKTTATASLLDSSGQKSHESIGDAKGEETFKSSSHENNDRKAQTVDKEEARGPKDDDDGDEEEEAVVDWNPSKKNTSNHKNNNKRLMVNPQEDDDHDEQDDDNNNNNNDEDDDEEDDEDAQPGELVLQGAIPEQVSGQRERVHSTITDGTDLENEDNYDNDDDEEEDDHLSAEDHTVESADQAQGTADSHEDDEEEEENATTMEDQQSLLILAAEHDRADILNKLLEDCNNNDKNNSNISSSTNGGPQEGGEDTTTSNFTTSKDELLHGGLPALHVAILYGSLNAINCLLRAGADPSLRPDLAKIPPALVQAVPNARPLDGVTAWELVFGDGNNNKNNNQQKKNGSVPLPPAKQDAIRHAFAAEALRCIGSDEVQRLQQLLEAGVPATLDIGGKPLSEWTLEMNATKCQELLQVKPASADAEEEQESNTNTHKPSAVLDRPSSGSSKKSQSEEESLSSLRNRLDELDALARALSTCLDNLNEEVSVCHGLLSVGGGGASALAAHVRSLKAQRERKQEEWMRMSEAWENSQDELAYWIREAGGEGAVQHILSKPIIRIAESSSSSSLKQSTNLHSPVSTLVSSISNTTNNGNNKKLVSDKHEQHNKNNGEHQHYDDAKRQQLQRQKLEDQIAASQVKVRKLRVSITDLSEENDRNLAEVERRGLTGGIQLVRNLRDEIRQVEFELEKTVEGEALCRSQIALVQAYVEQMQQEQQEAAKQRQLQQQQQASLQQEQHQTKITQSTQQIPEQQSANEAEQTNNVSKENTGSVAVKETCRNGETTTMQKQQLQDQEVNSSKTDRTHVAGASGLAAKDTQIMEADSTSRLLVAPAVQEQNDDPCSGSSVGAATTTQPQLRNHETSSRGLAQATDLPDVEKAAEPPSESERIATGQSTAIAISHKGGRGYFPLGLWEILLRIVGMGGAVDAAANVRRNLNRTTSRDSRRPNKGPQRQPAVII